MSLYLLMGISVSILVLVYIRYEILQRREDGIAEQNPTKWWREKLGWPTEKVFGDPWLIYPDAVYSSGRLVGRYWRAYERMRRKAGYKRWRFASGGPD